MLAMLFYRFLKTNSFNFIVGGNGMNLALQIEDLNLFFQGEDGVENPFLIPRLPTLIYPMDMFLKNLEEKGVISQTIHLPDGKTVTITLNIGVEISGIIKKLGITAKDEMPMGQYIVRNIPDLSKAALVKDADGKTKAFTVGGS